MHKIKIITLVTIICTIFVLRGALANESFNLNGYDPVQNTTHKSQVIPGQKVLKSQSNQLFNQQSDPIAGNLNGKITLIEFFDYRCPHSIKMNSVINSLIAKNAELRVVYKVLPKFGPISDYASRAAIAANLQHKYQAFHDALFSVGKNLSKTKILEIAAATGLNINKLKQDINSSSVSNILQANKQLSTTLGINAVPLIFIGKTSIAHDPSSGAIAYTLGYVSTKQIQQLINTR